MTDFPESAFTYPALVSEQTQKADTGSSLAVTAEFNAYYSFICRNCFSFSKVIAGVTHQTFVPYYDSKDIYFAEIIRDRKFHYNSNGYSLDLEDSLLELDSLTWMDTALTAGQYRLVDHHGSANGYPYSRIYFDGDSVGSYGTSFDDKVVVAGFWGAHDNATDAYAEVTATAEALDATETGIDIANGEYALFETYQYIRIDDELMLITAITEGEGAEADVLTVRRGVNGSTAATHDNAATITRWNVVSDVQLLATRMVAYWYGKRNDKGELVQVIDNALVIAQFSKELNAIATRRRKSRFGVA